MEEITNKEESTWVAVVGVLLICCGVIVLIMIANGMASNAYDCKHTFRFDYVVPGRKIGCWLNTEVGNGDKVDE